MDVLPKDITSFVWGLVVGGLVLFFSGVLKKAGDDSWSAAKARLFPTQPEPIKVAREFNPNLHEQGTFSWVPEEKIFGAEAGGHTFFRHPNGGAKCFRIVQGRKEFLMKTG